MGKYQHDMSGESKKNAPLPEGWRRFKITACVEKTSKQGNEMFVFNFTDLETKQVEEVYAIATQGKRWFLKMILAACNIPASEDGVYDWDIIDILDQEVLGLVKHEQEEWINRDGKTVTSTKGKIIEVGEASIERKDDPKTPF